MDNHTLTGGMCCAKQVQRRTSSRYSYHRPRARARKASDFTVNLTSTLDPHQHDFFGPDDAGVAQVPESQRPAAGNPTIWLW